MINKQRVKRIKNLIYAFIILVLFLPLILMSILSFRMIGLAEKMSLQLDDIKASVSSQIKTAQTAPDGGYVIEPESQNSRKPAESEELADPEHLGGAAGADASQSQDSDSEKKASENSGDIGNGNGGNGNTGTNGADTSVGGDGFYENGISSVGRDNIGGDVLVGNEIGINGSQAGTLNPGEPTQVGTGTGSAQTSGTSGTGNGNTDSTGTGTGQNGVVSDSNLGYSTGSSEEGSNTTQNPKTGIGENYDGANGNPLTGR